MPDLPTITVTPAQATRIQNAFAGATQAERVEAYRAWLRSALKGYVIMRDREALTAKYDADAAAVEQTVNTDLSGI